MSSSSVPVAVTKNMPLQLELTSAIFSIHHAEFLHLPPTSLGQLPEYIHQQCSGRSAQPQQFTHNYVIKVQCNIKPCCALYVKQLVPQLKQEWKNATTMPVRSSSSGRPFEVKLTIADFSLSGTVSETGFYDLLYWLRYEFEKTLPLKGPKLWQEPVVSARSEPIRQKGSLRSLSSFSPPLKGVGSSSSSRVSSACTPTTSRGAPSTPQSSNHKRKSCLKKQGQTPRPEKRVTISERRTRSKESIQHADQSLDVLSNCIHNYRGGQDKEVQQLKQRVDQLEKEQLKQRVDQLEQQVKTQRCGTTRKDRALKKLSDHLGAGTHYHAPALGADSTTPEERKAKGKGQTRRQNSQCRRRKTTNRKPRKRKIQDVVKLSDGTVLPFGWQYILRKRTSRLSSYCRKIEVWISPDNMEYLSEEAVRDALCDATETDEELGGVECAICHKRYKYQGHLDNHMLKKHSIKENEKNIK